jgi:hypothetical protein
MCSATANCTRSPPRGVIEDKTEQKQKIVGWAKRSVPTIQDDAADGWGHGASAPLLTTQLTHPCIIVIARSDSDEAIHSAASSEMDCFASLAVTMLRDWCDNRPDWQISGLTPRLTRAGGVSRVAATARWDAMDATASRAQRDLRHSLGEAD